MGKFVNAFAALGLCSTASAQVAVLDDIDVLFVFDTDAYPAIPNKQLWVDVHEDAVNAFLSGSGATGLEFDFHASTYSLPYRGGSRSTDQVAAWMQDTVATGIWSQIRGNNDLVFLVVGDSFSNGKCGRAIREDSDISIENGNSKYFAMMTLSSCSNASSRVIAHELGHALYADHQLLYNPDGTVNLQDTERFMDEDVNSPESYNHAWSNTDDTMWTLMGDTVDLSNQLGYFSSGDTALGEDPFWHDVIRMFGNGTEPWGPFGNESWTTVSRYRPLPQTPEPQCEVVLFGCNEQNREMVFVSFDEPPGFPATGFTVEKQISGGAWSVIGGLTNPGCIANAVNVGWSTFRVIMQTQYQSSQCQVTYLSDGEYCNRFPGEF